MPQFYNPYGERMSKYFKEIIFPTKVKALQERFDINNRPVFTGPAVHGKKDFEFWFIDITDLATKTTKLQLIALCPECETSFVLRSDLKSREIMVHALKENTKFYIEYVKNHCPYCYPGNPVKEKGDSLW